MAPTSTTHGTPPARPDALAERLVARARTQEEPGRKAAWDDAADVALAIRARTELLRAGVVPADSVPDVLQRAVDAAALVLSYEAHGDVGRTYAASALAGARGWGTSKSIKIGAIRADTAFDAYTTGMALGGLAELAAYEADTGHRAVAGDLLAQVAPVADDWLESRSFEAPGGGRAWEKVSTGDPAVRRYVVFNTDAQLARDFAVLSGVARTLGDPGRAATYEAAAVAVGRRLRDFVVVPVLGSAHDAPDASRWFYGLEVQEDGRVAPQHVEDTNHASYTLDFIALAVDRQLGASEGGAVFSRDQLERLGALLDSAAFVKRADGSPAYTVFVDPADADEFGVRGKKKIKAFAWAAEGSQTAEIASWWKELSGSARDLDMGLSIRTSWGWSEATASSPRLLEPLGRYLEAEARCQRGTTSPNVFLSVATWLRVERAAGR